MNYKETLKSSWQSALIILKLIIPIYIIADILFYYNTLSYIAFLIEPFTSIIGLPPETSLAIISGLFLNVYGAVAFAAPLELGIHQWSILAVFVGIAHSLPVEGVIMKKIGISNLYSYSLRIIAAFIVAYFTYLMPSTWFEATYIDESFVKVEYDSFIALLQGSIIGAINLTIKVIIIITILIFIMDFIKSRKFIVESQKNVSKGFSIGVGVILGITYGAGILIKEVKSGNISKEDIFYIATFLMICHAIIEDTLLFVIFGADFTMVVAIRTIAAIIIAWILLKIFQYTEKQKALNE
jgi:hypothetical protein